MTMADTPGDRPNAPICRGCWTTSAPGRFWQGHGPRPPSGAEPTGRGLHNPFRVKRRAETPVRPPRREIQFGRSSNWGRHDGECRSGRSIAALIAALCSPVIMSGHADIIDGDTLEIHGTRTRL